MIIFQVVLSISSMVVQNCFFNSVCKRELRTSDHVYRFNIILYAVNILLFGLGLIGGGISLFTVLLGLVFGVATALSNFYKMRSLSEGPMHITLLITTASMIIPTMSGVFFGESFSILKLIFVVILIGFLYLSFDTSGGGKINKKWIIFVILAFLMQGAIGVLQKVHQTSEYKSELSGFLFVAFTCSLLYSRIMAKRSFKELDFGKKHVIFAVVCGICTYLMNYLNLKLSGLLPTQLFFPLVNGSAIVLSSLSSVLIFKEKISRRQLVGLVGGIFALVAICLVK